MKISKLLSLTLVLATISNIIIAQEMPKPSAPRPVKIPTVTEKNLPNGLTVAVVERKNVPLVTIQLLVGSGASLEDEKKAGLANLTALLLTKGTRTRTAKQIAEQIEFLGGSINSGAGWNNSVVNITVSSDKLDAAMAILADVALNPTFNQKEIDLLKSQIQDGLAYNLQQPGFLANYVASKYSFREHPAGGTPDSIKAIKRQDILKFKKDNYYPNGSTLIFSGDITAVRANALARKYFGLWRKKTIIFENIETMEPPKELIGRQQVIGLTKKFENIEVTPIPIPTPTPIPTISADVERILVIDLPDSGQASVNFTKYIDTGRIDLKKEDVVQSELYFPALVLNSVLGGGYSSRLNQEIRIKRGLSYGAGSSFAWRSFSANFMTRTQTKNESAAEVAELVIAEIEKLMNAEVSQNELAPRKLVLAGDFGRDLETTQGLAERIADYYVFNLPITNLSSYIKSVNEVRDSQIKMFAKENFIKGNIIIVGDYAKFKDDLESRFPNIELEVIKADELDLSKDDLQK